jgi:hypothetical protein
MKDAGRNSDPLDAILRRAMRERPAAETPECADPESIAAYWDKSLAGPDRERLEVHLADCMRCQMLLAAIARADQQASDAGAAAQVPWYRGWRIAIPALAAVAAVAVFVAMRRPASEDSQPEVVAMAKPQAPLMAAPMTAPAPPVLPPVPPASPASAPVAPASNELAMNETKRAAEPRAQTMGALSTHKMARSAAAPNAPAGSAVPAAGAAISGGIGGVSANTAGTAGVASTSESYTAAGNPAEGTVAISPADQSVTWFVGKNGLVHRRDADGSTHIQQSGVTTDLVAGAAPSAAVCWVVGRSGTIIRTTDGEHWLLVIAPTPENLTGVTAGSAKDATITTAGGRRFATSDGGASWHEE